MKFDYQTIFMIVKLLAMIAFIFSVFKKSLKLIIAVIVIYLTFSIFFSPNSSVLQKIVPNSNIVQEFNKKKNDLSVVDTSGVMDKMDKGMEVGKEVVKKIKINLEEEARKISERLKEENLEDVKYKELNNSIKENYKELTDEDQTELTLKVLNNL